MKKKRLRKNKKQGMERRRKSGKKPMNAKQKEALKKLRESTRVANEAFHSKK